MDHFIFTTCGGKVGSTPFILLIPAKHESKTMTMQQSKRKVLKEKGWKLGTAAEFLGLSDEEVAVIELKLALGNAVKARRQKKRLTQAAFAKVISSSQSRVAKMEAGDPSVSLDLLVKSMLTLGASRREVANVIGRGT
jgi:DNA-binding XRE family transcriptional regulator